MTYPMEPVLIPVSTEFLLYRLRIEFGGPRRDEGAGIEPESEFRVLVSREVERLFGCPTPDELDWLIEEGRLLGALPDQLAVFIGRNFRLKRLRRYSNSSS